MIPAEDFLGSKILIVDDLESNTLLLEEILKEAGYTHVTSTSGSTPVSELHRQNRYDLILLDVQMPGQNGFEVMDSLKETEAGPFLPVLVMSGLPNHQKRALDAGALDFISKPFHMKALLERVRTLLESRLASQKTSGPDSGSLAQSEEA